MPITNLDFSRIHSIIYSYLLAEPAKVDMLSSCQFYAIIGSEILKKHYQIEAKPIAGSFSLLLDEQKKDMLMIGLKTGSSSMNDFHFWIEAENILLDFTSPLYPIMAGYEKKDTRKYQKVFIKSKADVSEKLDKDGDFNIIENQSLTQTLLNNFNSRLAYVDIKNICLKWFKKPPQFIDSIRINDSKGNGFIITDKDIRITKNW